MEGRHEQVVLVRTIDIAAGGMKVISPEPVPSSGDIQFTMLHADFEGAARVRYTSKTDDGFVIGLEFTPETSRQMFAYTSEPEEV